MSELSLYQHSMVLEKKRKALRGLLKHRDGIDAHLVGVRLDNCYHWTWELLMAVKKENKKTVTKAEFIGFFNREMSSEEKEICREFLLADEEIGLEIEQAIASGYKIGLSKDGRTDGYQATMQQMIAGEKNAGYVMSAFGKHWYTALGVLMFKHAKLLSYSWDAKAPSPNTEDFG